MWWRGCCNAAITVDGDQSLNTRSCPCCGRWHIAANGRENLHPQNANRICQAVAPSARSSLPDRTSSNMARLRMTSVTSSRGNSGLPASSWVPAFMTCQWRGANIAAKPSDNFAFLGCVKVSVLMAFLSCVAKLFSSIFPPWRSSFKFNSPKPLFLRKRQVCDVIASVARRALPSEDRMRPAATAPCASKM